jgi:hypothetical protein
MRSGRLEDALVLRPLAEQLIAAASSRPVASVAIAPDSPSLTHSVQLHWPSAEVVTWSSRGDQRADVFLALPSALLSHPLQDLLDADASTALVMVWDGGAAHENAVLRAWSEVCGEALPELALCAGTVATPSGWTTSRVIDVVRFDSVAQLRQALVEERGIVPPPASAALTDRIAHHLRAHEAADGTLRIPVRATLLVSGQPPAAALKGAASA